MSKTIKRAAWVIEHYADLRRALSNTAVCPAKCKSRCGNGRTCVRSSCGGWGYWVQALRMAAPGKGWGVKSYWSGSCPTPSTCIDREVANYIEQHCPAELR